ncbi:MAG: biotin/lipoyl-binding protein [Simkania sp.]|nr:biotin/lipoyl-binding protein [Simkania sp.]MCB1075070.1 biotin/lipoyl-binding protein [Simkania sp.]MCB1083790.1 biotin/lipoyl-binding protein [Simkania sp.]MCP5489884.1 biotin/lipoyl-binding protein [Chlamydiales bacterium]
MSRKFVLPGLAIVGLFFALFMVFYGMRTPPVPSIEFPPPKPPYKHYVAGSGTVEAASEDIAIGVPFNEITWKVFVKAGDQVEVGDALFELDTRAFRAELAEAYKKRDVSIANYENEKTTFGLYQKLKDKRAVSENEYNKRFYATEIALQEIYEAEANIERIETNIQRSIIRAPVSGEVLKVNIRVGESANINPFNNVSLIVFGDTKHYHVRVEVDEDDAWRIVKGEPAMAYVRGNSSISVPLRFLYIEPYVIPKTSLTGDNTERVDTRVLQIVYEMDRDSLPIYVGQIMDVYIKGLPSDEKF